jgi:hypothetical protein
VNKYEMLRQTMKPSYSHSTHPLPGVNTHEF